MKNYNDEYYIVLNAYTDDTIYLTPLQKTADRRFRLRKLSYGEEPLFFENSYKEEDIKRGIKHKLTSVLQSAGIPLVNDAIRNRLKFIDFKDMQLYPAVYIGDDEKYHENYWCMNFYGELDCWDREKSIMNEDDREEYIADPNATHLDVYKYHLSPEILDLIPEEERLIINIGGTAIGVIMMHKKIVDIFESENATGIRFAKVADFEEGMQF